MKESGLTIQGNILPFLLTMYVCAIFIWDYTVIYQSLLVIMVLATVTCRITHMQLRPYFIISALLCIYFSINIVIGSSVNTTVSARCLITLFINLAATFAIENILTNNAYIEKLMKAWIYISLITSIYILIADRDGLLSGALGAEVSKPFTGGKYSHNDIALIAAFSIVFLNYFKINKINIRCNAFLQVFFLVFIVLTGARKSLLLAAIGIIIYPLIIAGKNKNIYKRVAGTILAVLLLSAGLYMMLNNHFLYDIIGHRFEGFFSGFFGGDYTESSALSRSIMKDAAIGLIREKPIMGWGLDTFRTFSGSFGTWCHVNYLELWVSGGIIAVLVYYSFYVYAICSILKLRNSGMKGLFLVIMLFMLVMDCLSVTYTSRLMGIVYCMVDALICNEKKNALSTKALIALRTGHHQNES